MARQRVSNKCKLRMMRFICTRAFNTIIQNRNERFICTRAFNTIIQNKNDPNQNGILVSDILLYFRPRCASLKTHWEGVRSKFQKCGAVRFDEKGVGWLMVGACEYFIDEVEVQLL